MSERWPKTLFFVLTSCTDPAREDEFNDWYDNMHLPDLANDHGLTNSVRYRNLRRKEGIPQYLAIFDIGDQDPGQLSREIRAADAERAKQGRMLDCIEVWLSGAFERIER